MGKGLELAKYVFGIDIIQKHNTRQSRWIDDSAGRKDAYLEHADAKTAARVFADDILLSAEWSTRVPLRIIGIPIFSRAVHNRIKKIVS